MLKDVLVEVMINKANKVDPDFNQLIITEDQFSELAKTLIEVFNWVKVSDIEIPKDGQEYLVKNENQGGVLSLIKYNRVHNHYESKGKWVPLGVLGTHWKPVELSL